MREDGTCIYTLHLPFKHLFCQIDYARIQILSELNSILVNFFLYQFHKFSNLVPVAISIIISYTCVCVCVLYDPDAFRLIVCVFFCCWLETFQILKNEKSIYSIFFLILEKSQGVETRREVRAEFFVLEENN